MTRATLAIALSFVASAASANCPTTFADAARGVYVDFEGFVVRYSRFPDGTVEELEFHTPDANGFRYVSHLGIFILESAEMIHGVRQLDTNEVITYAQPLPAQITANMTYATGTTVTYANDAPFPEPLEITVGALGSEQYGTCTLSTLPVQMRTGVGADQYISNFTYFPALGFAIYVGGGGVNESPDQYPVSYIGTVPPSSASAAPATPTAPAAPAPASK